MLPCHTCAYRQSIPGNCHIRCTFAWQHADEDVLQQIPTTDSEHARKWFAFPFNYDPVWGPDECPAHAETADPDMVARPNPLTDLLSLLGYPNV